MFATEVNGLMGERPQEGSPSDARLKRFFHWLTMRTFQDLLIRDNEVAEYISDMLSRFARTDRLYQIRDAQGRPLDSVVEMLLEIDSRASDIHWERDFLQHTGDYILFMAGVFREYAELHGFLSYYMEKGPHAYRRVWELEQGLFSPSARLFERLWRLFEFHAGALHYMRKTFFRDSEPSDPFGAFSRRILVMA